MTILERQEDLHYRMHFNVGDIHPVSFVLNGFWLFINNLPPLFLVDTMGGIFLWLFIAPGIFLLWKKREIEFGWMCVGEGVYVDLL